MNTTELNYSPAKLYELRGCFYIFFYWRPDLNATFKRYKKTYGLNRIADKEMRRAAAQVMISTINEALKLGWNPETDKINAGTYAVKVTKPETLTALFESTFKSKMKRIDKRRTIQSFNSNANHFRKFLKANDLEYLPANEFTQKYAVEYQNYCIDCGLSPITINTKTEYLAAIFKHAITLQYITANPFAGIEKLKEKESDYYELFTYEEIERIKICLIEKLPALWQIFLFHYYALMRTNSVAHLKASDIMLKENLIRIDAATHKNGKEAFKELLPDHRAYIEPYISSIPANQYIFSKNFAPGPRPIIRNRISEAWHELIITGLGIDKKLYGAKATGAAHFLELNKGQEPLKWLQMQMSHADLQTTSIYTNKLKVVKIGDTANVPKI